MEVVRVGYARVAELADALDLGSSIFGCGGSSPPSRTKLTLLEQARSKCRLCCWTEGAPEFSPVSFSFSCGVCVFSAWLMLLVCPDDDGMLAGSGMLVRCRKLARPKRVSFSVSRDSFSRGKCVTPIEKRHSFGQPSVAVAEGVDPIGSGGSRGQQG